MQSPLELTIQFTYQTMNLRQKFLLASKIPSVDILFDDVLTHIKYLVAVVEEVIHFIILLA